MTQKELIGAVGMKAERERERFKSERQYDRDKQKETQWHTNRAVCLREESMIEDDNEEAVLMRVKKRGEKSRRKAAQCRALNGAAAAALSLLPFTCRDPTEKHTWRTHTNQQTHTPTHSQNSGGTASDC